MADPLINVAVVGPHQNLFTYKIRSADEVRLQPGCRLLVPFGPSVKMAFFVEYQREPVAYRLKFVKERLDTFSPFPDYLFSFCRWMAGYYYAGLGEVLAAALPGTGRKKPKMEFAVADRPALERIVHDGGPGADLARRLLRYGAIKETDVGRDNNAVGRMQEWLDAGLVASRFRTKEPPRKLLGYRLDPHAAGAPDAAEMLSMLQPGVVYTSRELLDTVGLSAYRIGRLTKQQLLQKVFDAGGVTDLTTYPIRHDLPGLELLAGQKQALDEILPAVEAGLFAPFLLFGITGSGKTLVYCHAARRAVEQGGSVLVMVPEIALAGLLLSSFAAFFGDQVAVMHSGLTPPQRLAVRERIAAGVVRIVIGPRSAIFAPLKNPRLIIIDEEHDPSYKQDDPAPRYHARDAAVMLARTASCPIILGSASPSVESYHNAVTGRYRLLTLDQRPRSGYRMPQIVTLDMKSESIAGECSFLSFRLKQETERRTARGEQVIYYLNRRGFSPRLKCRDCGEVPSCPDCGVRLAYHKSGHQLKCHFCDRIEPAPTQCPRCGSPDFLYLGAGTQRVEENLARLFADVRAVRIDSDRTAVKAGGLILGDFAEEKYNLLIGTQMVTKGLDFPNVTLVGVLAADIGLDMPDFRAAEKTYARLLQVAGRAGRGDREGLVMIQTWYSDHPVIRHLTEGNYLQFYESIIEERRQLSYPPFGRLINITLTGKDEKVLETESLRLRDSLAQRLSGLDAPDAPSPMQLLGPAPAPMYKLRGNFRRRLIIKTSSVKPILARLRVWESEHKSFSLPSAVRLIIDVDPVNMM